MYWDWFWVLAMPDWRASGWSGVAFTVWSVEGLRQARRYGLPGGVVGAPVLACDLSAEKLAEQMHREGCCIMVHGSSLSDKPQFIHRYLGQCINRIYTDTWSPGEVPPGV